MGFLTWVVPAIGQEFESFSKGLLEFGCWGGVYDFEFRSIEEVPISEDECYAPRFLDDFLDVFGCGVFGSVSIGPDVLDGEFEVGGDLDGELLGHGVQGSQVSPPGSNQ